MFDIATTQSPDDEDGQQEKYDRITPGGIRIQIKYRGGNTLHIEQRLVALLEKTQPMVPKMVR